MKKILCILALIAALGACNWGEAGVVACDENEVAAVLPDEDGKPDPFKEWACVTLDDFADEDSIARLDAILADR